MEVPIRNFRVFEYRYEDSEENLKIIDRDYEGTAARKFQYYPPHTHTHRLEKKNTLPVSDGELTEQQLSCPFAVSCTDNNENQTLSRHYSVKCDH